MQQKDIKMGNAWSEIIIIIPLSCFSFKQLNYELALSLTNS